MKILRIQSGVSEDIERDLEKFKQLAIEKKLTGTQVDGAVMAITKFCFYIKPEKYVEFEKKKLQEWDKNITSLQLMGDLKARIKKAKLIISGNIRKGYNKALLDSGLDNSIDKSKGIYNTRLLVLQIINEVVLPENRISDRLEVDLALNSKGLRGYGKNKKKKD